MRIGPRRIHYHCLKAIRRDDTRYITSEKNFLSEIISSCAVVVTHNKRPDVILPEAAAAAAMPEAPPGAAPAQKLGQDAG